MKIGITKKQLVESLGETLSMTREGISHLELKDNDTVTIHYTCGHQKDINIAMNSGAAIIRDVARHI